MYKVCGEYNTKNSSLQIKTAFSCVIRTVCCLKISGAVAADLSVFGTSEVFARLELVFPVECCYFSDGAADSGDYFYIVLPQQFDHAAAYLAADKFFCSVLLQYLQDIAARRAGQQQL